MHIAIINNYKISNVEYNAELYQLIRERKEKKITTKLKKLAINNLIDAFLLIEDSQKYDIQIDEQQVHYHFMEFKKQYPNPEEFSQHMERHSLTTERLIEHIRNNLHVKQFIKLKFIDRMNIDHSKICEYYKNHKHSFKTPEKVKLCHILIRSDDSNAFRKIEEISKRLFNNDDFYEVAKVYSDCPSATNGGDLGYISRGKLVKEIEDIAFTLPIGEIAGPIRTKFGYHFIKLMDKKKSRIPEFEEIKDSLKRQLEKVASELELLKHIRNLRAKAKIIIHEDSL
ncbi:MAG: peptidylprolyl isomerase [Candidatus Cloacimonetes bacterium]|nr:peptidylprolyl isomerase [Candidatus Cloacimonadota bacterium]